MEPPSSRRPRHYHKRVEVRGSGVEGLESAYVRVGALADKGLELKRRQTDRQEE